MKLLYLIIILITSLSLNLNGQSPCINGMIDNTYPCNQTILMSHLTPSELGGEQLNDIWGWTDPQSGKEYALVGLTDGISFVDISTPTDPKVIGKLIEPESANNSRVSGVQHGKSSWRDAKVYKDHIFVISDNNAQHGMQVFDLTRLRSFNGIIFQNFDANAFYGSIGSSHNIAINEATGYAYIVGTQPDASICGGGGLHVINIQEPSNPIYENCFDKDGYTHDAQCVIYNGSDTRYSGMEICFNSNEDTFTIVNVTDKSDMNIISRSGYDSVRYTHQGWLTEDHRFYLMNDELDEREYEFNARTLIWNVEDLENPIMIGEYYNEAVSIDHNLYTHMGMVFESNYTSGLRVLDLDNIENGEMRELAFLDTYPSENSIVFAGSWSNYPYFESGNIIVSDMENGLFILQLDLKQDPILNHPKDTIVCEGVPISFTLNSSSENLEYQWQTLGDKRFINVNEDSQQTGAQTSSLQIFAIGKNEGRQYRCKVADSEGNIFYSFPAIYKTEGMGSAPVASFTFDEMGQTIAFKNESLYGDTFLWDFGDGNISREENPVHTYENFTKYTVELTITNSCGSATFSLIISPLANNQIRSFNLYPNPAKNFFTIDNHNHNMIELRDLSGKLIFRSSLDEKSITISLKEINPGLYIATLLGKNGNESIKLVVE